MKVPLILPITHVNIETRWKKIHASIELDVEKVGESRICCRSFLFFFFLLAFAANPAIAMVSNIQSSILLLWPVYNWLILCLFVCVDICSSDSGFLDHSGKVFAHSTAIRPGGSYNEWAKRAPFLNILSPSLRQVTDKVTVSRILVCLRRNLRINNSRRRTTGKKSLLVFIIIS